MFGKIWTVFGPRAIGILAGGLASFIFAKTKGTVTIDPTTLAEYGTTLLTVYAASHKAASVVINPGDTASPKLAEANKDALATGAPVQPAPPSSAAADYDKNRI